MKRTGAVVILDALGIKGVWQRADARDVVHRLYHVSDITRKHVKRPARIHFDVEGQSERDLAAQHRHIEFRVLTISDTVIIVASGMLSPANLLRHLSADLYGLYALALRHGVIYRGAVAFGDFYVQGPCILGPAVDEAAEWHLLPEAAGILLTPSAGAVIDRLSRSSHRPDVLGYARLKVPLDNGVSVMAWVLDWYRCWMPLDPLERNFLRPPVSPDVTTKLQHTLTLCKEIWTEFEKRNKYSLIDLPWRDVTDKQFDRAVENAERRGRLLDKETHAATRRVKASGESAANVGRLVSAFFHDRLAADMPHRDHLWKHLLADLRSTGRGKATRV